METPARAEGPSPPEPRSPLVALREEVREAGARVGETRTRLRGMFWIGLVVGFLSIVAGILLQIVVGPFSGGLTVALAVVGSLLILVDVLVAPLLFPVPMLSRGSARRRLARLAAQLPPEQVREALAPLRREPGSDSGKLATALLRDLGRGGEVTPAATPEGSGTEVTRAE